MQIDCITSRPCRNSALPCGCMRRGNQLNGLGFIDTLLSAAGSLFAGGQDSGVPFAGGPSGSLAQPQPITVSPEISTQISPTISPVFQQQFQPTNSAATAGTAAAPAFGSGGSVPASGGYPGQGGPLMPVSAPDPFALTRQAASARGASYPAWLPYAVLGAGIGAYFLLRRKKKA